MKLRHHRGPVYTVPFGQLGAVQNMSRDWVIDKMTIGVTYDSDVDKAKKLIKDIGKQLAADPEFAAHVIEPLKMQGVEQFGDYRHPAPPQDDDEAERAVRHAAPRARDDQEGLRRERYPVRVSDGAGIGWECRGGSSRGARPSSDEGPDRGGSSLKIGSACDTELLASSLRLWRRRRT